MKKPNGLIICVILLLISAAFFLFEGIFVLGLVAGYLNLGVLKEFLISGSPGYLTVISIFFILIGLFSIYTAIGVLKIKNMARAFGTGIAMLDVLIGLNIATKGLVLEGVVLSILGIGILINLMNLRRTLQWE